MEASVLSALESEESDEGRSPESRTDKESGSSGMEILVVGLL
jgi:hypothetical protein